MPQKIKILFLIDHLQGPGGTEKHLTYLTSHLSKEYFQCSVLSFNLRENSLLDQMRNEGVDVISLRVARYYTPSAIVSAIKLAKIISDKKIDIVQTYHFKSDVYGALVARVAGVKHIVASKRDAADLKNNFHFFLHRLVRFITQRYIVVSDAVGLVVQEKEKVARNKIVKIYNGVDCANYFPADSNERQQIRAQLKLRLDSFVLVISAWLRDEKDHLLVLEAVRRLLSEGKNMTLLIVGDGKKRFDCESFVTKNQMAEHVVFVGGVKDVIPYLKAADAACLVPKENEGFSNSVLEKMAMALPMVVTDVGGNKEAVLDNFNGFVIQPRDVQGLTDCLARLHDNPELRLQMGRNSRHRAEQSFSMHQMVKAHKQLYRDIMLEN